MTTSATSNGFYFSLPRLLQWMVGGPTVGSENHASEAYFGSLGAFLLAFVFGWEAFGVGGRSGWTILAALLLIPAVWIFWILVFYLNSLLIKLLKALGFLRQASNRGAQNTLIGVVIAILAWRLSILPTWPHWIGIVCLSLLLINFVAAALLKFLPERTR